MDQNKSFLKLVLDSLVEGVVVADNDGSFVLFNHAAENILGMGSLDLNPEDWTSAYGVFKSDQITPYPAEELPLVRAMHGETVLDELIYINNPTLSEGRWIDISANPIRNDREKVIAGAIIFRDVSERIKALEQMSVAGKNIFDEMDGDSYSELKALLLHFVEFQEKYKLLTRAVQETEDSIVITDANGLIIYVNSGFEKTTGYMGKEVIGQTPRILKSGYHNQDFYNDLWQKISTGNHFRGTILNKKKNGETYWSEQTITPIRNDQGIITNYVSVLKDITDLIEKERLERELELAAQIQLSILPESLPSLQNFNIGASIKSARHVCGDFYDIIPISENKIGILIGDVVDKGITAALMMARVHALIASEARRNQEPGKVLYEVNDRLSYLDLSSQLTTVIYGILDCKKYELSYARAGHEPPFILAPDGRTQERPYDRGMVLGLFNEIFLDEQKISIPPGETLLLFTDGLVDCRNLEGKLFGYEGVENNLRGMRGLTAQEICDSMQVSIEEYQQNAEQYDDITIFAIQANSNES